MGKIYPYLCYRLLFLWVKFTLGWVRIYLLLCVKFTPIVGKMNLPKGLISLNPWVKFTFCCVNFTPAWVSFNRNTESFLPFITTWFYTLYCVYLDATFYPSFGVEITRYFLQCGRSLLRKAIVDLIIHKQKIGAKPIRKEEIPKEQAKEKFKKRTVAVTLIVIHKMAI